MSSAVPRSGWADRIVLLLWRCYPGSARERYAGAVAATLASIRAEIPSRTRNKGSDGSSYYRPSGAHLVFDALATLLRAWITELVRRSGYRGQGPLRSSTSAPPPGGRARFSGLIQDVRHATRTLVRTPVFTGVAVLTLGLGIGATTTFFTLVDGVLLDPLPYADPDRVVKLKVSDEAPLPGTYSYGESYPDLLDLRREQEVFSSLAAFIRKDSVLMADETPVRVDARFAEPEIFELLGAQAALGRVLAADDRDAIVLDAETWRTQFDADPEVLGSTVSLDQRPYIVVGVMPPGFLVDGVYPLEHLPVAWVPLESTPSTGSRERRRLHYFNTFGRLAEGVTMEQAQQAMTLAGAAIHGESRDPYLVDLKIWVTPFHAEVVGNAGDTLWLLLGAVGFLLLITCANVANLQLTRLAGRRRQTAVRRALGAGRARIVRELLAENLILGLLGGATGLLLTHWGLHTFVAFSPGDLPRLGRVDIDAGVLAFVVAVSLGTGLVFGLAPAWRGSRAAPLAAMRGGAPEISGGVASRRLRSGLLAGELALAVVLLAGAGLVGNSFVYLSTAELGFDPTNVLTFRLDLGREFYEALGENRGDVHDEIAAVNELQRRMYERLETIPGIETVAGAERLLSTWSARGEELFVEGRSADPDPVVPNLVVTRAISGDYLDVLGIPLLAGRSPRAEHWIGRNVERTEVLLSEAAVQALWPGTPVAATIGRRVRLHEEHPWAAVVGVVAIRVIRRSILCPVRSSTTRPAGPYGAPTTSWSALAPTRWRWFPQSARRSPTSTRTCPSRRYAFSTRSLIPGSPARASTPSCSRSSACWRWCSRRSAWSASPPTR